MRGVCYEAFLEAKRHSPSDHGFEPLWIPDYLFDFQAALTAWAIRKGRCGLFEDCGLGKTIQELVWAENVVRHTNRPVLILTPLAVASQTAREADKFGVEAAVSRDGEMPCKIVITNYERLHYFEPDQFAGVVCDESAILKNFGGVRRKRITRFMSKLQYRLLGTATAAPNDYVELGTSSEALGELSHSEMLKRFFQQLDDKGQKKEKSQQGQAEALIAIDPNYFKKLAYRVAQTIGQWRLRHHAIEAYWRWVASWARACRLPSDLGFDDGDFILPELTEQDHIIEAGVPPGMLFTVPAIGMAGERDERRRTLTKRCEYVAGLVNHDDSAVVWCHMNEEGDLLEKVIPGAAQIAGRTPDERKIELYEAFASGQLKKLVIKPKIGAWGLNWQHCNHVVTFPTHSWEQYYQLLRRCWRFGQHRKVRLDVVATEGEVRVLGNMRRKGDKATAMHRHLVASMNQAEQIERRSEYVGQVEVPSWA